MSVNQVNQLNANLLGLRKKVNFKDVSLISQFNLIFNFKF